VPFFFFFFFLLAFLLTDFSSSADIPVAWGLNERGTGYTFGRKAVVLFHYRNRTGMIIRSHQLVQAGCNFLFEQGVLTVWSSPNHNYRCGNQAAVFKLPQREVLPFKESTHVRTS